MGFESFLLRNVFPFQALMVFFLWGGKRKMSLLPTPKFIIVRSFKLLEKLVFKKKIP